MVNLADPVPLLLLRDEYQIQDESTIRSRIHQNSIATRCQLILQTVALVSNTNSTLSPSTAQITVFVWLNLTVTSLYLSQSQQECCKSRATKSNSSLRRNLTLLAYVMRRSIFGKYLSPQVSYTHNKFANYYFTDFKRLERETHMTSLSLSRTRCGDIGGKTAK